MKHLIVGGLVVVGFCAAFFVGRSSVSQTEAETKPTVCGADAARLEKAERRIADLEQKLAAARKAAKAPRPNAAGAAQEIVAPAEDGVGIVMSGGTNVDILAELRKNLSEEEFGKATNAMERLKARMAAKAKGRIEFLKSVDVSAMSKEDRDQHAKFIELAERREAVKAKMKFGLPDQQTLQEMMEVEMQMMPLAKKERAALSRELARELGYAGDDADAVCDAVGNIIDSTSGGGLDGMMDAAEGMPGVEIGTDVQVLTL